MGLINIANEMNIVALVKKNATAPITRKIILLMICRLFFIFTPECVLPFWQNYSGRNTAGQKSAVFFIMLFILFKKNQNV
jgi:hypothetical protein